MAVSTEAAANLSPEEARAGAAQKGTAVPEGFEQVVLARDEKIPIPLDSAPGSETVCYVEEIGVRLRRGAKGEVFFSLLGFELPKSIDYYDENNINSEKIEVNIGLEGIPLRQQGIYEIEIGFSDEVDKVVIEGNYGHQYVILPHGRSLKKFFHPSFKIRDGNITVTNESIFSDSNLKFAQPTAAIGGEERRVGEEPGASAVEAPAVLSEEAELPKGLERMLRYLRQLNRIGLDESMSLSAPRALQGAQELTSGLLSIIHDVGIDREILDGINPEALAKQTQNTLHRAIAWVDNYQSAFLIMAQAGDINVADAPRVAVRLHELAVGERGVQRSSRGLNPEVAFFLDSAHALTNLARFVIDATSIDRFSSAGSTAILQTRKRFVLQFINSLCKNDLEGQDDFFLYRESCRALGELYFSLSETERRKLEERYQDQAREENKRYANTWFYPPAEFLDILRQEHLQLSAPVVARELDGVVHPIDLAQLDSLEAVISFFALIGGRELPDRKVPFFDTSKLKFYQLQNWRRIIGVNWTTVSVAKTDLIDDSYGLGPWKGNMQDRPSGRKFAGSRLVLQQDEDISKRIAVLYGHPYDARDVSPEYFFEMQATMADFLTAFTAYYKGNQAVGFSPDDMLKVISPSIFVFNIVGYQSKLAEGLEKYLVRRELPASDDDRTALREFIQQLGTLKAKLRVQTGLESSTPLFPKTDQYLNALQEFFELFTNPWIRGPELERQETAARREGIARKARAEARRGVEEKKAWQGAAGEMARDTFARIGFERSGGNEIVGAAAFEFRTEIADKTMGMEMFTEMMSELNGIAKHYETQLGRPPEQKLPWPQVVDDMGGDNIAKTAFERTGSRIAAAAAYRFRQGILKSQDEGAGFKEMMTKINEAVGKHSSQIGGRKAVLPN